MNKCDFVINVLRGQNWDLSDQDVEEYATANNSNTPSTESEDSSNYE